MDLDNIDLLNDNGIPLDIESAISAKTTLECVPRNERNVKYTRIIFLLNEYLRMHCKHTILEDSIDITTERSQTIYYCTVCYLSFDGLSSTS